MIVCKTNYCDLLKSPSWPPFSFSMGPVDTSVENTGKNTVVPFGIFYTWTLYYLALKLGPCYSCTEMFTFRTGVLKYMYLSIWPACYQLWYSIRIKIKTVNGDCLVFRLQKKETIYNYGIKTIHKRLMISPTATSTSACIHGQLVLPLLHAEKWNKRCLHGGYLSIFMHTLTSSSDDFAMLMMFFFKDIIPIGKEITFILQYLAVLSYTPTVPFASA